MGEPDKLGCWGNSRPNISAIEAKVEFMRGKLGAQPGGEKTDFTYTVTLPSPINSAKEYEEIIIRTLE